VESGHGALDIPGLRKTLAEILSKRNDKGSQPSRRVRVRAAAEGDSSSKADWVIKQTLESGPFGIIIPGVESGGTGEGRRSQHAIPQQPGSKLYLPMATAVMAA